MPQNLVLNGTAANQPYRNEPPAALNEEVQSRLNQSEVLDHEESAGRSISSSSQEVLTRMPSQRHTARINNDVTVGLCYKMDHKNRGLCLIFSHELFKNKNLPNRPSAAKEGTMIETIFDKRGFRVLKFFDCTYKKIKKELRELENKIYPDDDCICICVSTHGQEGILWALDCAYSIDIFADTLAKIKKLTGKPKLMFTQACRGKKIDRGINFNSTSNMTDSDTEDETDNSGNSTRYPTQADFLIVHSTAYGYVSWRDWFFMAFCYNLDRFGETDDIDEILRKTIRKMCVLESRCQKDVTKNRAKQVPTVYSTLTKRLFLKRK